MKYRSEIDGLRALAVLPVIFFHSKFSLFQGGFVGVDIFFVISGFLITKIILTEVFQSSFSLLNFYERRARRILPALFTVLIVTTMGAWLLLPPQDFKDYGQSLFFVSFFASNIFFWIESGYFGAGIDFKPLLHTWSLGVEEQFYIFFPVMVVLLFMINKKLLLPSILIIFLVSLIISQIYSGDQNHLSTREAAFFLLPSRAWELMIGSLLFFIKRDHNIFKKRKLGNFFSATGLILIIYSILFFSEETPFPSTYTLLPTIGAALIILFASQQTFVYKILSLRPMIFIGLISYSAYLWHQPILSLSRYYFVGELGVGYIFMSITFIFLFAYLSWRYIEKPFRDKSKVSRKSILTFSIIGLLFFSIIGFSIHFKDGYQSRFSEQENELLSFINYKDREELYRNRVCFLRNDQDASSFGDECKKGSILVWGDSHAASLSYGMRSLQEISQFTSSGCPPILNFSLNWRPNCDEINDFIYNFIVEYKPSKVIISSNWISRTYKGSIEFLKESLEHISFNNPETEFIVLGGLPQWLPSLPNTMLKANITLDGEEIYLDNLLFDRVAKKDAEINRLIASINSKNLRFLSLLDLLCRSKQCLVQANFPKIEPITFDHGHLTGSGSFLVSELLFDKVKIEATNSE